MGSRVCEKCGHPLQSWPLWPKRTRDQEGRLVCDKCAKGSRTSVGVESMVSCVRCGSVGSLRVEAGLVLCPECTLSSLMPRIAHDHGDGEIIAHCPFCGSGDVLGRSDGSAECRFCKQVFTVQVQPPMPSQPQTVNGEPRDWPGQPGGPLTPEQEQAGLEIQMGPEDDTMEQGPPPGLPGAEEDDEEEPKKKPPFPPKGSARTASDYRGPHHSGDYDRKSDEVRAKARSNPDTKCRRCGEGHRDGDPWVAGHVKDGDSSKGLAPEHRSRNAEAGGRKKRSAYDPDYDRDELDAQEVSEIRPLWGRARDAAMKQGFSQDLAEDFANDNWWMLTKYTEGSSALYNLIHDYFYPEPGGDGSDPDAWRDDYIDSHNGRAPTASKMFVVEGVAMPEDSFIRRLAVQFADDREAVIEDIRAERGQ